MGGIGCGLTNMVLMVDLNLNSMQESKKDWNVGKYGQEVKEEMRGTQGCR